MAGAADRVRSISRAACYIIGSAIGSTIGSRMLDPDGGEPGDLRYGGAALGGLVGWFLTPLLLRLAMAAGISRVPPPTPYADEETHRQQQNNALRYGLGILIIGAIGNLALLVYTLLEVAQKKGMIMLVALFAIGAFLGMLDDLRGGRG